MHSVPVSRARPRRRVRISTLAAPRSVGSSAVRGGEDGDVHGGPGVGPRRAPVAEWNIVSFNVGGMEKEMPESQLLYLAGLDFQAMCLQEVHSSLKGVATRDLPSGTSAATRQLERPSVVGSQE